MEKITEQGISGLAGIRVDCGCGRQHRSDIERIEIGGGADEAIAEVAEPYRDGAILISADNNTYRIKGEATANLLRESGFRVNCLVFQSERALVPDEAAVGRLVMAAGGGTSLIVAVGSGTINDLCRYAGFRLGIPYCVVATAPSMDGYASTVSPLIVEGFKTTFEATGPIAILGDTKCLANAPSDMVCAGFGDIIGKFTALADWELSRDINSEYYCADTVALMRKAVSVCAAHARDISKRDERGVSFLMEALVLSGIAMGFVGNSRPASGAEHILAHFWEMDALRRRQPHALHGNMVGVGALVISRIYEVVGNVQKPGFSLPEPALIKELLETVGCPTNPAALGVSEELFHHSLLHAKKIRPRYTVFNLAEKLNLLSKAADDLTREFYRDAK